MQLKQQKYSQSQNQLYLNDFVESNVIQLLKKSQHVQQYQKQMENLFSSNSYIEIILNSQIFEYSNEFEPNLISQIIESDLQSNKFKVRYGNFITYIYVIITKFSNEFYSQQIIAQGGFGQIFKVKHQKKKYAVKSVDIGKNNLGNNLDNVFKQYFITLLASTLQFGPKIHKLFGYDIVVTQEKAYFAMELCSNIKNKLNDQNQKMESQLKNNLKIMHSLKLVHLDIKLQNISFSRQYNKYIFLDFGLSLLIKEQYGFKTYIYFKGTLSNCSQQMKMLYLLGKQGYIDLYYNDLIGLKKILKNLKQKKHPHTKNNLFLNQIEKQQYEDISLIENININNMIDPSVEVFKIKYFIFCKEYNNVNKIISKINKKSLIITIYNILFTLKNQHQFNLNKIIKDFMIRAKDKLYQDKYIIKKTDLIFNDYFTKMNNKQNRFQLALISQIFSLSLNLIQEKLNNIQWIYKIYIIFDPFWHFNEIIADPLKYQSNNWHKKREIIIQKLCLALKYKQQSKYFYFKVRFVLIFFSKKLKCLGEVKVLYSIRLLFITIQDFINTEQIQQEILLLLYEKNKIAFLLKILQFYLFWRRIFITGYYKLPKWKCLISQLKVQQKNSILSQLKFFILQLLSQIEKNYNTLNKKSEKIFHFIQKCQLIVLKTEQKLILQNIKYICNQLFCQTLYISKKIYNLTINIYSMYFCSFFFVNSRLFVYFQDFFTTFQILIRLGKQDNFQINLKEKIQNIRIVYSRKIFLLSQQLITDLFNFIKECNQKNQQIIFQLQKLFFFIKQSCLNSNNLSQIQEFQFSFCQIFVMYLLKCLREINYKSSEYEKQKMKYLLSQICTFFRQLKIVNHQLLVTQKIIYQILQKYIECVFNSNGNVNKKNILSLHSQLYSSIKINQNLKIFYFEYLQAIYQKCQHNNLQFNTIILKIGLDYQQSKKLPLFQMKIKLMKLFITLKVQEGLHLYIYQILKKYFHQQFKNGLHQRFYQMNSRLFIQISDFFCQKLSRSAALQMYQKKYIAFNFTNRRAIIYLNFVLFAKILQDLNNSQKYNQLIRISKFLPFLQTQFFVRMQPTYFRICRKMKIYKSARKAIKCTRLQIKSAFHKNFNVFLKLIQNKLKQLNNQTVYNKILHKMKQIQNNSQFWMFIKLQCSKINQI